VIRFHNWMMHATDPIIQWAHDNFTRTTPTQPIRRKFYFWLWLKALNAHLWASRHFLEGVKREQRGAGTEGPKR
jgi:hypothetical protein